MRIGIIHEGARPDWPIKDLQKQATDLRIDLQLVRISELFTHFGPKSVETLWKNDHVNGFDAFIVRGLGWPTNLDMMHHRVNLLSSLEEMGKPVMNPAAGIVLARDKERSLAILASRGFKVPETFVCEDLSTAMKISRKLHQTVIKPLQGSRGLGVISVDNEDLAFHVLRIVAQSSGVFYLQRRVSNLTKSLRIFTIGDEALGCMSLKPQDGSWKTNAAQKGLPSRQEEFENEGEIAVRAANSLGCWYAGVDLLVAADGEQFIAEVNSSPSWQVFSAVTGTNPANRILQFLSAKVDQVR